MEDLSKRMKNKKQGDEDQAKKKVWAGMTKRSPEHPPKRV